MTLFRRTHFPSPAPAAEDMPPRPASSREQAPALQPRGAMTVEGCRVLADDPCCGAGPMAAASSKNGET